MINNFQEKFYYKCIYGVLNLNVGCALLIDNIFMNHVDWLECSIISGKFILIVAVCQLNILSFSCLFIFKILKMKKKYFIIIHYEAPIISFCIITYILICLCCLFFYFILFFFLIKHLILLTNHHHHNSSWNQKL